jgi:hypothetical protein
LIDLLLELPQQGVNLDFRALDPRSFRGGVDRLHHRRHADAERSLHLPHQFVLGNLG